MLIFVTGKTTIHFYKTTKWVCYSNHTKKEREVFKMEDWPYAKLSKAAKEAGGPDNYLKLIKDIAKDEGLRQGRKQGAVLVLISTAIVAAIYKFLKKFFGKKENHEEEVEKAKEAEEKLIKGINEYDESH